MNEFRIILLLIGLSVTPMLAQTPDSSGVIRAVQSMTDSLPDRTPIGDSVLRLKPTRSMAKKLIDTLRVGKKAQVAIRQIVPRQATFRSLMFPGLGQVYNHDYWKLPIIYGGFAVLGYYINMFSHSIHDYTQGYEVASNPTNKTKTAIVLGRELDLQTLQFAVNKYTSWRNGDIILAVGLYALTAVEANVAAHLKTFDLSENLSLRVRPTAIPMGTLLPAPGIRISLIFK